MSPQPNGPAGDLPALVARFTAACHAIGLPVGPERAERLARAIVIVAPTTTRRLYYCALATLVSDPAQIPALDRVFAAVFGGMVDEAGSRGDPNAPPTDTADGRAPLADPGPAARAPGGVVCAGSRSTRPPRDVPAPVVATPAERLGSRDFDTLSPEELAGLVEAMSAFRVATPLRRSRRTRRAAHGDRVDLRRTLRAARRTDGDPVVLARHKPRRRPRRLVVLCAISGSMEP